MDFPFYEEEPEALGPEVVPMIIPFLADKRKGRTEIGTCDVTAVCAQSPGRSSAVYPLEATMPVMPRLFLFGDQADVT